MVSEVSLTTGAIMLDVGERDAQEREAEKAQQLQEELGDSIQVGPLFSCCVSVRA